MHVERTVGDFPKRPDHRCPEGEIGHEVAVHHVHVNPLRAAGDGLLHLLPQPSQIGAEHTGRNSYAHWPPPGPPLTTRSTADPLGRPAPDAGRVASTTPASCGPRTVSTLPRCMPAVRKILSAEGRENPIRSGTVTGAGPALSTSCTTLLGGSTMPGGGSCQITIPR